MPSAVTSHELTGLLDSAGYRPITCRSYLDFISGVRYVSVETLGSEGFKVLQFIPTADKSAWDIVRWEDNIASFIVNSKRSDLSNNAVLSVGYDWYAKVAERVCVTRDYFIEQDSPYGVTYLANRGWHFKTLECFLGDESENKYGHANPFDVEYAFNRAHPREPVMRELTDMQRVKAELESRERAIQQKENFAEADELRLIGAQHAQRGMNMTAQAYFRESDALRRRIQEKLDRGEPITRENVVVREIPETPEPRLLPMRDPPKWTAHTKLEIVKTHKRQITLE